MFLILAPKVAAGGEEGVRTGCGLIRPLRLYEISSMRSEKAYTGYLRIQISMGKTGLKDYKSYSSQCFFTNPPDTGGWGKYSNIKPWCYCGP
jgi:hypothetical protein